MYKYNILRFEQDEELKPNGNICKSITAEETDVARMVAQLNDHADGHKYYFERVGSYIPHMDFYKSEIERAFGVLGLQGEFQNEQDIDAWKRDHRITNDEADGLRAYNKRLAKSFADLC